MKIHIITIFPELFDSFLRESLIARAQKKKLLSIQIHNLRAWTTDKHKTVDEKPFGGGLGMVMRIEPIFRAISTLKSKIKGQKSKVILFTPRGKKFTQTKAYELAKLDQLILLCGRYEGIDERVAKYIADDTLSLGDYVLMGGEIPAMTVVETVARLIPGIVGKPAFLPSRCKGRKGFMEYPQYTRPPVFRGWKVPRVLLSGNHKKIEEWKKKHGKLIGM